MAKASLRRRRLASALKQLREQSELSINDTAERVGWSHSKVSRIESATIGISGDDTFLLCGALGVSTEVTDELISLARQAKRRDWWHVYPQSAISWATDLLELEADAQKAYLFVIDALPGVLQTEAYARTIIRNGTLGESEEKIQERVDIRMRRREQIATGELELWVIIDEPALYRRVGGNGVMADQLTHLAEMAGSPHVSVQILQQPAHIAMAHPFMLYTLADGYECVAFDTLNGCAYNDEEDQLDTHRRTWARLAADALNFERSAELLSSAAHELRSTDGPRVLRVAESDRKRRK